MVTPCRGGWSGGHGSRVLMCGMGRVWFALANYIVMRIWTKSRMEVPRHYQRDFEGIASPDVRVIPMMEIKTDKILDGKHIAVAVSSSDNDAVIGRICWYTICELLVPTEKLYELLQKNNIPKDMYPSEPRASDCFKKAIQKVSQKNPDYIFTEERIVDVGKVTVNPNTRLLVSKEKKTEDTLPVIGVWSYDKDTETIIPTLIDKERADKFAEISNQVMTTYETLRTNFDEKNVRDMIRSILYKTYAVSMRDKGSIYFVSSEYTDILIGIANVINSLRPYAIQVPSEMVTIPVIDTEDMRNLISIKFEQEVVNDVKSMLVEITDIIHNPDATVLPCKYKQYAERLKYLRQMAEKYKVHIEVVSENVNTQLDILQKQLVKLADKIKN